MTAIASNYVTSAEALYVAYLGRPADVAGLNNLSNDLDGADTGLGSSGNGNGTAVTPVGLATEALTTPAISSIVTTISHTTEAEFFYNQTTAAQYVQGIFQNLFDRTPAAAGLQYWTNAVSSGAISASELPLQILASAQGTDLVTVNNKIAAATAFSQTMATDKYSDDILSYSGAAATADVKGLLATVTSATNVVSAAFVQDVSTTITNIELQHNLSLSDSATLFPSTTATTFIPSHVNLNANTPFMQIFTGVPINTSAATPGEKIQFTSDSGPNSGGVVNITAADVANTTQVYNNAGSNQLADLLTAAIEQGPQHGVATFFYNGNTYLVEQSQQHSLVGSTIVELVGSHTIATNGTTGYVIH